jgi:hypothetical protein
LRPARSAYTVKEHRRCTEHDIKPALGSVRLDKLTARQLDAFCRDLLAPGLSPASVRRFHSVLHAALDRAVKWGMIPINPSDRATPPGLTRSDGQKTSALWACFANGNMARRSVR